MVPALAEHLHTSIRGSEIYMGQHVKVQLSLTAPQHWLRSCDIHTQTRQQTQEQTQTPHQAQVQTQTLKQA